MVDGATLQVVFCTAVISPHAQVLAHIYDTRVNRRFIHAQPHTNSIATWNEPIGAWDTPVVSPKPLEQLSVTKDKSDFLWYETSVTVTQDQIDNGM